MNHLLAILLTCTTFSLIAQDDDVVHYEQLKKAIDISVDGFQPEAPAEGTTVNYGSSSYSAASIRLINDMGDYIDIQILDYSTAMDIYAATSMGWALGITIDSDDEKAGGVEVSEDLIGWESIKKKTGIASLTLGAKEKYIIVVEMNNQSDTENAKSVAKKVKIHTLP